jgi:ribonucleoside-diphosphate reductase alpha chain
MLDDKPYEVFITTHFTNELKLSLKKISRGRYDLYKGPEIYSEHISSEMTDEQEAITRLVSTSLRHGADIKFIVEQLNKTSSDDMFTFTKSLARVLKKYIPDGAKSTVTCDGCGSENVIFVEGCRLCQDCGSSKCG